MISPAFDLSLDLSDRSASSLLALVGTRLVKAHGKHNASIVKSDGSMARIRACLPSTRGRHAYEDQDLSSAVVRLALGYPDQAPTGGAFPLAPVPAQTSGLLVATKRYLIAAFITGDSFTNVGAASNATGVIFVATGITPTTWTNASSLLELTSDIDIDATSLEIQAALNATAGITALGGVIVSSPQSSILHPLSSSIEVYFNDYGPHAAIAGPLAGGLSPSSVISVSRVQPGVSATPGPGVHEVQLIRLLALPYVFDQLSTPFPVAAATVEEIQPATANLPATQRLTIDPDAYDGHINLILDGNPIAMPFDASEFKANFLAGPSIRVTKFSSLQWDFSGLEPAQAVVLTVASVASLKVPRGVTGPVTINTVSLLRAFAATSASFIKLPLHITIQWPGQQPMTAYLSPPDDLIEVWRGVLDLASIAPPTLIGLQFVGSIFAGCLAGYDQTITALRTGPNALEAKATTALTFGYLQFFYVGGVLNIWRWVSGAANPADPTGNVAALDSVIGYWERSGL